MRRWIAGISALALAGCASAKARDEQDAPPVMIDAAKLPDGTMMIDANTCATAPCDIQAQCGCSMAQACDIDFSDLMGNACRDKIDTGIEGKTCACPAACAKSYVCLGSGQSRQCERYCSATADCISPRGQCVIQITSGGNPIPGATVCSSNCDPAAATNPLCPTNFTCDLFTSTFQGTDYKISDCRIAGAAAVNATCSTSIACAAGLTCVTQGAAMTCKKICPRPQNTGCPGATACTSFGTPFTVAGQEYGVCL